MTIKFLGFKITIEKCLPVVCDTFQIVVNTAEREKLVQETVNSEFFQDLQSKAKMIRQQRLQNV